MSQFTKIKVSDYYGKPEYFEFMPDCIFIELERAFLSSKEIAVVKKNDFDIMVNTYGQRNN